MTWSSKPDARHSGGNGDTGVKRRGSTARDMVPHARSQPHIGQLCGRSKTCRCRQHSGSLSLPMRRNRIECAEPVLRLAIGCQIGQVHIVIALFRSTSRSGSKIPGSLRLKWPEKIRSRLPAFPAHSRSASTGCTSLCWPRPAPQLDRTETGCLLRLLPPSRWSRRHAFRL